eukprot:symbB.v1.2.017892.t1/scaffold1405.1/size120932/6
MADSVLMEDGSLFFDLDHTKRFAALYRIDWAATLNRFFTKTHREVHSMWGFLASTHRVWLVHGLLFTLGLTLVAGNPEHIDFGHVALLGTTFPIRLAAIGLLVPLHAMLWGFARYHTTGSTICRRIYGPTCMLAGIGRSLLWASPLFTYAVLRYIELKGVKKSQTPGMELGLVLAAHTLLSVLGFIAHLFFSDRTAGFLMVLMEGIPSERDSRLKMPFSHGHEFIVPKMPKTVDAVIQTTEEAPDDGQAMEGDGYEEGVEVEEVEDAPPEEPPVPLLDDELKLADSRFDSKVDPQLNRIADQVNQKIDLVEERLLGDRLQNVVVPLPATNASQDASSVHVFLGSSSNPDVGSPLDEVNQLLQKATKIQKGLVGLIATSNLQLLDSTFPVVVRSTVPLVGDFEGSFLAQGLLRRKDFL